MQYIAKLLRGRCGFDSRREYQKTQSVLYELRFYSVYIKLVFEMSVADENHSNTCFVASVNGELVFDTAARLHDSRDACENAVMKTGAIQL